MGDEPRSRDQLAGLHDPFRRVLRRSRFPRGRPVHLALRLSQEQTMGRTAIGTAWETVARTSCSRSTRTRAGSPCTRRWALPGPRATLVAYWIAQKLAASVRHTEASSRGVARVGRSDRSRLVPRDDITFDERGAMVRNGLSSGPALVLGPDTDFGRGRGSARPDHYRGQADMADSQIQLHPGIHSLTTYPTSGKVQRRLTWWRLCELVASRGTLRLTAESGTDSGKRDKRGKRDKAGKAGKAGQVR